MKVSYMVTGNRNYPVLPRVMMKCHHCGRVMTLKNFKEGELLDRVEQDKYYIWYIQSDIRCCGRYLTATGQDNFISGHHDMGDTCNKRKLMIRKGAILRTHEKLETSLRTGTVFHVSFFICWKFHIGGVFPDLQTFLAKTEMKGKMRNCSK